MQNVTEPTWLTKAQLKHIWSIKADSTFYDWLKKGHIPQPRYPFGPSSPRWLASEVKKYERAAEVAA